MKKKKSLIVIISLVCLLFIYRIISRIFVNGVIVVKPNFLESNIKNEYMIFYLIAIALVVFLIFLIYLNIKLKNKYTFGETGKDINYKDIKMNRDVPSKDDIFKTFFITTTYEISDDKYNFLGSMYLKLLCDGKINVTKITKKGKKVDVIKVNNDITLVNKIEKKFLSLVKSASNYGKYLDESKLKKWLKKNYSKVEELVEQSYEYGKSLYEKEGLVTIGKKGMQVNPVLKEEADLLAGLKKFLVNFTLIEQKKPIEVKLWKEYLIYGQMFGIAKEVNKIFRKFYPEITNEMIKIGFDNSHIASTINFSTNINEMSQKYGFRADAVKSILESNDNYSSGGGGFSSGGGGGGSFGGGKGGSR